MKVRQEALPGLERAGWQVGRAVDRMRGGERTLSSLLETASDDNSKAMIEYIWSAVCGAEAAERHYPPQPRLEGKMAISQSELQELLRLLTAGPDAEGWVRQPREPNPRPNSATPREPEPETRT